jgi:astacin (peptidase family M12A)
MFYAMQLFFIRASTRKVRAARFFWGLTMVLCMVFFQAARAGNYFQGVSPATAPWPGGIVPYLFDTNYTITATESNDIIAGLDEWELAANVQFVPYTNQTNHVLLQYTNDGTGTGYYLRGNPGTLMLHGLARGLICHEGGHLFGLQHEHQRIDRGNYITINTNNINVGTNGEGGLAEFLIDSNSTSFGAYDLESVMHYGPDSFTNGLGDSLDPLPAYTNYYHEIGNLALSIGDRAAVSNLYGATPTSLTNMVTNTADGGFGSLRAAIYYANSHPGTTIKFDIPASDPGYSNGVYTISLLGELPPLVSAGTVVDGTTEPGYGSHPIIALDGSQVSPEAGPVSGLHLYGANCTVRALAFDHFSYAGIQLLGPDAISNTVEGCYMGLKPDGTNAAPNFLAGIIFQYGANDNFIGGLNATQRNVISGNSEYGIVINDNSDTNVILGNYIGLNASGTAAVTNFLSGIGIWGGPAGIIIGGTNAGARNVISGNWQYGIYLDTNVSDVTIQGNYIGTDFTGSNSVPNGNAVTNAYGGIGIFSGANGNIIGGAATGAGNLISGNTNVGIYLSNPGVSNNVVQGNYIGVNVSGKAALTRQQFGIYLLDGASGNTIGGTSAAARNLISGNLSYGIYISDPGTSSNLVLGNTIGPDVTGTNAIGDGGFGVGILNGASGNFIGGAGAGDGNLISGDPGFSYGIAMFGADSNVVQGNLIGTDLSGKNVLANGFAGVALEFGSAGNLVGGAAAGAGNVISGNGSYGVYIYYNGTSDNLVQGNTIGTDITGKNALANGFAGVVVFGTASSNLIGGTIPGAGNLISGNGYCGVYISDTNTSGNLVQGNTIGTDLTGTNALGNGSEYSYGANVVLENGATGNFIGGIGAGEDNIIADSASGPGVLLYNTVTTNNAIRGNSIFGNNALGIDLNGDGVTLNHIGFLAGPNDLQNFPVISNAVASGSSTIISGSFNSLTNDTFFIDVYRNLSPDPSGYGEGQFYAGSTNLTTDGNGNGTFTLAVGGNYAGQYFSATATSSGGDTSEFCADVMAVNVPEFISPFTLTGTGFNADISVTTGQVYSVEATTNLAVSGSWVVLTNFTASSTPFAFTDRSTTNFHTRFYRVVSP